MRMSAERWGGEGVGSRKDCRVRYTKTASPHQTCLPMNLLFIRRQGLQIFLLQRHVCLDLRFQFLLLFPESFHPNEDIDMSHFRRCCGGGAMLGTGVQIQRRFFSYPLARAGRCFLSKFDFKFRSIALVSWSLRSQTSVSTHRQLHAHSPLLSTVHSCVCLRRGTRVLYKQCRTYFALRSSSPSSFSSSSNGTTCSRKTFVCTFATTKFSFPLF